MEALRSCFRPELLGRVDEIICFHPLGEEALCRVAEKLLLQLGKRLEEKGISLRYTEEAVALLAQSATAESGARPIRKALRDHVEDEAAQLLLQEALVPGDTLYVTARDGVITTQVKSLEGAGSS
jgi:ATP-dependent Clp protease ATP-binding subunit ClpA